MSTNGVTTTPRQHTGRPWLRRVLTLVGLIVAVHFLLPLLAGLRSSLTTLSHLHWWVLVIAAAMQMLSLLSYARCARAMVPGAKDVGVFAIARAQVALLGLSHVLPGGGASAAPAGYRLLQRAGLAREDAGFLIGVQAIASAGVLNALLLLVLAGSAPLRGLNPAYVVALLWAAVLAVVAVAGGFGLESNARWLVSVRRLLVSWLPRSWRPTLVAARSAIVERGRWLRTEPRRAAVAAAWAAAQWLIDFGSLWLLLLACGARVAPDRAFIPFALSQLAGMLPISIGGLGVVEATLTAALAGVGVAPSTAVVAVLAYRLVEFWLPIPVGVIASVGLRRSGAVPSDPAS